MCLQTRASLYFSKKKENLKNNSIYLREREKGKDFIHWSIPQKATPAGVSQLKRRRLELHHVIARLGQQSCLPRCNGMEYRTESRVAGHAVRDAATPCCGLTHCPSVSASYRT